MRSSGITSPVRCKCYLLTIPNPVTPAIRVAISPGSIFIQDLDEWLDFNLIWMTYGLCPLLLTNNTNGIAEIPLPWLHGRISPWAHGFEWKITPSPDGRFLSECLVLRNTNLDLGVKAEMARPDMSLDRSLTEHNRISEGLLVRKSRPDGNVEGIYKCTEWYSTNGIHLPRASELARYWGHEPHPVFRGRVSASTVLAHDGVDKLMPRILQPTLVADYRYRPSNNTATLPSFDYLLRPGDNWKADNDPKLLREVQERFRAFVAFQRRQSQADKANRFLTWLVLAAVVAPLLALLRSKKQKTQ